MPVDTLHPEFARRQDEFLMMRDTIEGEREVKHGVRLTRYLPVPPGLDETAANVTINATVGKRDIRSSRYAFYASFAEFPELPGPTIEAFQGMVHQKPPRVELPEDMKYLLDHATPSGESLMELWEMHTRELFSVGRFVLLGEVDETDDEVLLCPYVCESLINWQETSRKTGSATTMVVLREFDYEFEDGDGFDQKLFVRFRELRMRETENVEGEEVPAGATYQVQTWRTEGSSVQQAAGNAGAEVDQEWTQPARMGVPFDFIPIIVSNTDKEGFEYGRIPVLPISRISLSIFRTTADYKRALYIKGDPQVVIYGIPDEDAPETIGGSEIWTFDNENAKAEYLDIDGNGIPLMRESIRDDFERYVAAAGRLMEHTTRAGQESGQAVEKRLNAQHVTVVSTVIKAGQHMQKALRMVGQMMGKSNTELQAIIFEPNVQFASIQMTGQELLEFVSAKNMGAPISRASIHHLMQRGRVTDMTLEEEESAIETEPPPVMAALPPRETSPTGNGPPGNGGNDEEDSSDDSDNDPSANES